VSQRFRFTSEATGAHVGIPITRGMLLNLVTMATTTTNQFRLFGAVRLKKIQMWAVPVSSSATQVTASIEWIGVNSPSVVHADTSMGNARPLHVTAKPPPNSSNRWWSIYNQNEAENLCKLTFPASTIIDVTLEMRVQDDEGAMAGQNGTGAASTIGVVYVNYLDGFVSKLLLPIQGTMLALP
jgi:hypothetical protein